MMRATLPCDTSELKASVPQNLSKKTKALRGTLTILDLISFDVFFLDMYCKVVVDFGDYSPGSEVLERAYVVSRRPW